MEYAVMDGSIGMGAQHRFKLVPNDVTEALLRDWEVVRQRIADGETRAFAFVEVKKDMSLATMWAKPECSCLVDNVIMAGVQVLLLRLGICVLS